MVRYKACPRCRGDVVLDKDRYGRFWECIACGWHKDLPIERRRIRSDRTDASLLDV